MNFIQQRGTLLLAGLLAVLFAGLEIRKYCLPRTVSFETILPGESIGKTSYFEFDPNAADSALWVRLGFSPSEARSLVRYRSSLPGGRFRSWDEFSRAYALSPEKGEELRSFIRPDSFQKEPSRPKRYFDFEINSIGLDSLCAHALMDESLARRLVERRTRYGGFVSLEQLCELFPKDSLQRLEKYVRFDLSRLVLYQVNRDHAGLLSESPYISRPFAENIVRYREQNGPFASVEQLREVKYCPRKNFKWFRYYISVD